MEKMGSLTIESGDPFSCLEPFVAVLALRVDVAAIVVISALGEDICAVFEPILVPTVVFMSAVFGRPASSRV